MKILDFKQGSPEWLQFRRTKIMASDCPTIMEGSPSELLALYENKISGKEKKVTPAMQRGKDMEEDARREWCTLHDAQVFPAVILSDEHEWMGASLDGLSKDGKIILEIKCPGDNVFDQIESGIIPKNYIWQVQHQLCVSGNERAYLFIYSEDSQVEIVLDRDEVMIGQLTEKERDFYHNNILTFTPPCEEMENRDDPEMSNAMARLEIARIESEKAGVDEKIARDEVIRISGGKSFVCFGRKGVRYIKKGSVEYQKIPELKGVDLDKYRKADVECWRID